MYLDAAGYQNNLLVSCDCELVATKKQYTVSHRAPFPGLPDLSLPARMRVSFPGFAAPEKFKCLSSLQSCQLKSLALLFPAGSVIVWHPVVELR